MNSRKQVFELQMEGCQIEESIMSLFHTVMLFRADGKYVFENTTYKVGQLGWKDVDCDQIDLTYVRVMSARLDEMMRKEVYGFSELMRADDCPGCGEISLEFVERRQGLIMHTVIPWEVWTIKVQLKSFSAQGERDRCREELTERMTENIFYINNVLSSSDHYLPKVPGVPDLGSVYDMSYNDIQIYNHKYNYSINRPFSSKNVSATVGNFLRTTLIH